MILFFVFIIVIVIIFIYFREFFLPKLELEELNSSNHNILLDWYKSLIKSRKFNGVFYFKPGSNNNGNILVGGSNGSNNYKSINKDSIFHVGSISKQFTAFGIMLLKRDNLLSYETEVCSILNNFPSKSVTIRNLLNHTSSINIDYVSLFRKNNFQIINLEILVEEICKTNVFSDQSIGTHFFYNNTNYILLARIIEVITKESYEEFISNNIFKPLGMKNSKFLNKESLTYDNNLNIAIPFDHYLGSKPHINKRELIDQINGDKGVYSNIEDLIKWINCWKDNPLIEKNNLNEAFEKPLLSSGKSSNYGFGWVIESAKKIWHNGSWKGSNSLLIFSPDSGKMLIILDNSSNLRFNKIENKMLQIF